MHNANKPHQNEGGRSHRPVAVYLMKLQEHRFEKKIIFKDYIHLKRAQNCKKQIQKANLNLPTLF